MYWSRTARGTHAVLPLASFLLNPQKSVGRSALLRHTKILSDPPKRKILTQDKGVNKYNVTPRGLSLRLSRDLFRSFSRIPLPFPAAFLTFPSRSNGALAREAGVRGIGYFRM